MLLSTVIQGREDITEGVILLKLSYIANCWYSTWRGEYVPYLCFSVHFNVIQSVVFDFMLCFILYWPMLDFTSWAKCLVCYNTSFRMCIEGQRRWCFSLQVQDSIESYCGEWLWSYWTNKYLYIKLQPQLQQLIT